MISAGREGIVRRTAAIICAVVLALAACGGDDGDNGGGGAEAGTGDAGSRTADIEPCSLLTESELTAVLGVAPPADESEPAGPFTGCSWGTGDVIVSIATSDSVILAPGEDECPSANLGDESYACEQRVKFLTNGIHVTVSTINAFVTNDHLHALAEAVLPKLPG